mgnify:CR=1
MSAHDGPRCTCTCHNPKRLSTGHRDGSLVIVCGLCWRLLEFD